MIKRGYKKNQQKFKPVPFYLNDEQAEKVGGALAVEFHLKPDTEHSDRFQTVSGSYTKQGIARRFHRIMQENL